MNIFKMTLLASMSILFIGCSNTPESTVENMYMSMKNGDIPKLYTVTTESKAKDLTLKALETCSVDKLSYKKDDLKLAQICFKEMHSKMAIKNITVDEKTETEALISITYDNNAQRLTKQEYLRNRDGDWLVFINKFKTKN